MDQHVIDYLNNKKEWEAFLAKLNEFSVLPDESKLKQGKANAGKRC